MKAILKDFDCLDGDMETYTPDSYGTYIFLTLSIGPENIEGEELFRVKIVDIKYLSYLFQIKSIPIMGKGFMVVKTYNPKIVIETIKECIAECDTGDWDTTAVNLSRYFDWEFENYKPYVPES